MDSGKKLERANVEIGQAAEQDVSAIYDLQQKLLVKNRSEDEKLKNGFVSVENSREQLAEIVEQDGITVARDNGKMIGYVLPLTLQQGAKIPLLKPFMERFEHLQYEGKPLREYKYCIIGQIGVEDRYAGRGIPERIYPAFAARMADRFDLGVTEVGANNPRSLHVHRDKMGLSVAEEYSAEGRDWYILIMDFRKYKSEK